MASPKSRAASTSKSGSSNRVRRPKRGPGACDVWSSPATAPAWPWPAGTLPMFASRRHFPPGAENQVPLSRRRLSAWVFGLLGTVVLIVAGAVLLLVSVDLRPWIEEYGSNSLDRRMTIGTLRIGWGDPLSLELRDFRLANASWGSSPEMVQIESVSAEIDPWSLFGGAIRFEKLEVVQAGDRPRARCRRHRQLENWEKPNFVIGPVPRAVRSFRH